jgi:surface carbohydrate biosynthesis protein
MLEACYIRVEVKKRELVSRIDLALEFVKQGIPVIIGEVYDGGELKGLGINRGYIFGKCAQTSTLEKFASLLDEGWKIGAIDEEGLLPNSMEEFAAQRFSKESAEHYSDVFFFGEAQKRVFETAYGASDNFFVSGNPRIDMWRSHCYRIHQERTRKLRTEIGCFSLFPLNFGYYTNSVLRERATKGDLRETHGDLVGRSEFLFSEFCRLATEVVKHSDCKVVFRPHPSDLMTDIGALLSKHGVRSEKVICDNRFDVFPWIDAAASLVHNCCTTSLEAGFNATPVATYVPEGVALYSEDSVNDFFPIYDVPETLAADISNGLVFDEGRFLSAVDAWPNLWYSKEMQSSTVIANRIVSRSAFSPKPVDIHAKPDVRRAKKELLNWVFSALGDKSRQSFLDKFPPTPLGEVQDIIEKILLFRQHSIDIEVEAINSRLFAIQLK